MFGITPKSHPHPTPPEIFPDFGQKITEDGFAEAAAKNAQRSELGILKSLADGFVDSAALDFCVFKKPQFRTLLDFLEKPSSVIICPNSEKKSGAPIYRPLFPLHQAARSA